MYPDYHFNIPDLLPYRKQEYFIMNFIFPEGTLYVCSLQRTLSPDSCHRYLNALQVCLGKHTGAISIYKWRKHKQGRQRLKSPWKK